MVQHWAGWVGCSADCRALVLVALGQTVSLRWVDLLLEIVGHQVGCLLTGFPAAQRVFLYRYYPQFVFGFLFGVRFHWHPVFGQWLRLFHLPMLYLIV